MFALEYNFCIFGIKVATVYSSIPTSFKVFKSFSVYFRQELAAENFKLFVIQYFKFMVGHVMPPLEGAKLREMRSEYRKIDHFGFVINFASTSILHINVQPLKTVASRSQIREFANFDESLVRKLSTESNAPEQGFNFCRSAQGMGVHWLHD